MGQPRVNWLLYWLGASIQSACVFIFIVPVAVVLALGVAPASGLSSPVFVLMAALIPGSVDTCTLRRARLQALGRQSKGCRWQTYVARARTFLQHPTRDGKKAWLQWCAIISVLGILAYLRTGFPSLSLLGAYQLFGASLLTLGMGFRYFSFSEGTETEGGTSLP